MTTWATHAIEALKRGETVQIRPRGHSMSPRVKDRNLVTLEPLNGRVPKTGDVVLVTVRGRDYLHLIKAVSPQSTFLIGNNKGGTNGWAPLTAIHGLCVAVEG